MLLSTFAFLALLMTSVLAQQARHKTTPVLNTTNGPITGYIDPTTNVHIYKNIPYGADTLITRFLPPKPPTPWNETKTCTSYGPIAPQTYGSNIPNTAQSEDCLNLNVWTGEQSGEKRPVLVYFHGGGYESGTVNSDTYDGTNLAARRNAVVVTVNHRINGFGYLYLGALSAKYNIGNAGQADLILALEWVRDNIEKFGGDKEKVLIFGQSGGGAKCATLMAQPAAKGLFSRVWTMSGQQITGRTMEHAVGTAEEVLRKVKLDDGREGSKEEKLEKLLNMSTDELEKAMSGGSGQKWTPVVDGISLPIDPFWPVPNEQSRDIPMVIGNTYDETRTLIGSGKPNLFDLTWEEVPRELEKNVKAFIGNITGEEIVKGYRGQYPDYTSTDVFFAATTAARSWKSMVVESDVRVRQQSNSPTWVYYMKYRPPYEGGKYGAAHGFDIPLVFANSDAIPQTRGDGVADELGEAVSKILVEFASNGSPEGIRPDWKKYAIPERTSLIIDRELDIHADDRGWERRFFESVPYIQPGT
ncbi:alpha/beta-hydrolase [Tothia fuscella]|uniref:Carboxylic ester hydrolase n=1 Tax=Tothia fuscella TaxID=1048955 RepID=A0A9P4TWF1_9PEZI|nr:alpha/beta-hydrolase [Tothia fuscella]